MSPSLVISPAEAQETVEKIAEEYGWVSQTARQQSHQHVVEAIIRLQIALEESTRILAQLPDRGMSRFMLEMIQNADANSYSKAEALGEDPYIKFSIRPGVAIVEYNEDGFTQEDVRALCLIDEKKRRTNAGPKGVGFKLVFMVASKIHIQSGPFSFSFAHEPRDNGMGTIVPKWEPSGASLAPPLTRITLTLRDFVKNPESLGKFNSPQTTLLFMKKLRRIIFEKHLPENRIQTDTYSCEVDQNLGRRKVHRVIELIDPPNPNANSSALWEYHIARKSVPPVDEQVRNDEDVVILVFLIKAACTEDGKDCQPDLLPCHQFSAYLPIQKLGFPFILDPDFDTQEDLREVLKTPRNQMIFESAAEAFADTVAQFCQDPFLQYKWTKYIPEDGKSSNPFWSELGTRIKKRVKTKVVLWPRSRNGLRLISQLRIVGKSFTDGIGQPLVPDLPGEKEMYLHGGYSTFFYNALPKLEALGLKTMTIHECIDRIAHDAKSQNSRMRLADDSWHERIAMLLLIVLEDPNNQDKSGTLVPYIKSLPLIPLAGQRWTSTTSGSVFFPDSNGCQIPEDLGLRLVDSRATGNTLRKNLFARLGVVEASTLLVKSLILEKHKGAARANISLQTSVKHLHYLYSACDPASNFSFGHRLRQDLPFCLFDERGLPVDDDHELYLETEGEFHAKALLGLARQDSLPTNSNSFGSFISKEYFRSAPKQRLGASKVPSTLEDWLRYNMQVFKSPQLVETKDRSQLSPLFLYLLDKHPLKALGVLKAHWSMSYSRSFSWHPKLKQQFSCITNIGKMAVGRTFLPLEDLEARCSQFLAPINFPFLQLPGNESKVEDWKFLQEIGVGMEANIDFYLEILRQYKNFKTGFPNKIYEAIQKKVWALEETSDIIQQVRNVFANEDLIHVPPLSGDKIMWTNSDKCFWDGPSCLTLMHTLLPALSRANNALITAFFVETLCIHDISHTYLLEELEFIRVCSIHANPAVNADHVREIYDYLDDMIPSLSHEQVEEVRNAFENKSLIYEPSHNQWAPTSSCFWSKDDQIPGKVTISHQYAKLKDFFVRTLKVKIQDVALLVDELAQLVNPEYEKPSVRDVKSLIWQINDLSPSAKDLEKLKSLPIFPVQLAGRIFDSLSMQAENGRFSINDRKPLAATAAFGGKVDLLDFKLDEVRKLHPFLSCFNLEGRYLSRAVTSVSSLKGEVSRRQRSRELTVRLRNRAYALARCAAHFNSPRILEDDKFIYNLFQHTEVYETNVIATTLTHTLYDTVEVEVGTNKLHLSESSGVLKIYVPKSQRDQDLSFLQDLPIRLFNEVLMNDDSCNSTRASNWEAVRIIAAILESGYETISDLLDEAGIIPVPYYDIIDIDSDDEASSDDDYLQIDQPTDPDAFQKDNRAPSPEAFVHPNEPVGISSDSPVAPAPRVFRPFRVGSVKREYCQLLDNVIAVAQGKSGMLPSKGLYNFDAWHDALREVEPEEDIYSYPYYSPLGFRSREQKEHSLKLGAAGELYVFEVLSKLKLPSFYRGNWKSKIRHYVAAHEKYANLQEWQGQDVDMVYDDKEGVLTENLIDKGHLSGDSWNNAKPKYWLEVKTTTRKCGARFYLTGPEYERMKSMRLTEGQTPSQVYIILRVFDLDKETIGMRLYVDPWNMERRGELRITQMPSGSLSVQDIGGS